MRESLERDTAGELGRIAGMGIEHVELAGTYGLGDKVFGNLLKDIGLNAVAAHVGLDLLENPEGALRFAEDVGVPRLVLPWVSAEDRADYKLLSGRLAAAAEPLKKAGLEVSYHHHDFEFTEKGIDALIEGALAGGYDMEIDTYWAAFGGSDPAEVIRRCAGCVPTLHLKDGPLGGDASFVAVGEGDLDMKAVTSAAKDAGVDYGIIELDWCPEECGESVRKSYEWLTEKV